VIGVGTVMHKFQATNGKDIFLPAVSFHLPTADIRLVSPQSYHQQWGGYSLVGKEGVVMNLWRPDGKPSHVLKFQLDEHSNTPTAVNVVCTAEEREMIRPYLWSSCASHSLAFNRHDQTSVFECEQNFDTDASLFPLVADPSNVNLTPGKKERCCGIGDWESACYASKSLWFLIGQRMKMGCKTECLVSSLLHSRLLLHSSIPCCAACESACVRHCPTGATKQLAVEDKAGILSANQ
jgi:hypothetical protein